MLLFIVYQNNECEWVFNRGKKIVRPDTKKTNAERSVRQMGKAKSKRERSDDECISWMTNGSAGLLEQTRVESMNLLIIVFHWIALKRATTRLFFHVFVCRAHWLCISIAWRAIVQNGFRGVGTYDELAASVTKSNNNLLDLLMHK